MNFVAIDFETGNYSRTSAISIGLVKYIDGMKSDSYYSLIRPPVLFIRPDFTAIHGLTVNDVVAAPPFSDIWPRVNAFIGDIPLVAHNAQFDIGVLCAVCKWHNIALPRLSWFDSLAVSRRVWPKLASHALVKLGLYFGIEYNAHNALSDSETCGKIILLASKKLGVSSVKELLSKCRCRMHTL